MLADLGPNGCDFGRPIGRQFRSRVGCEGRREFIHTFSRCRQRLARQVFLCNRGDLNKLWIPFTPNFGTTGLR